MRVLLFLLFISCTLIVNATVYQSIEGIVLQRNGLDSSSNTLLFNLYSKSCKNCIYLNTELIKYAKGAGYTVAYNIYGLAKEDTVAFKEENGFADNNLLVFDYELGKRVGENSICLIKKTKKVLNKECGDEEVILIYLKDEAGQKGGIKVDSVQLDTSYKFYSGSAAFLNDQYSLVMDFRHSRVVHKINMQTGGITGQFKIEEKEWAKKLYNVIYNGDMLRVSKSLSARQKFIKKDRLFGNQEFEPENITTTGGRILLSVRFSLPYIENTGDTLSKKTKVIFQLDDSLQITDYWVPDIGQLKDDFYITDNTNMVKLLVKGDTVFLPVAYIDYNFKTAPKKYNYGRFILEKGHKVVFHSYLPFVVPDEKAAVMPDYHFLHIHLLEFGTQVAGSYVTFPGIYNLTANTKIRDIELIGSSKKKWAKLDSVIFAKDIGNLKYMVTYFDKYLDKYYLMQARNAAWNTYTLFDAGMQPIKTVYISPATHEAGNAFYAKNNILYVLKEGANDDSGLYIHKYLLSNIFSMEIE